MLEDSKVERKEKFNISLYQKSLFKALLFLLPLAIFPFPWDWTEAAMSLLILSISMIILGLEVIKLFWDGKLTILKSTMDIGFFLLLLSLLLSTIFSTDFSTSIWGVDGRLGGGLILFISILFVAISSRTFIKGEEDVHSLIMAFLIGFFINNFLSLLSFFGINIWGLIPAYRDLYQAGLPLLRSSKIHLLINFVNIIVCIGIIGEYLINSKRKLEYILSFLFGLLSVINIWFYSINQKITLTLFLLVGVAILLLIALKGIKLEKETSKQIFLFSLICIFLIAIPVIFLQIPRVRDAILTKEFEMISEVSLGFDISWIITGSVIVSGFVGGLLGFGPATYSIVYHMFKPYDLGLLMLGDATFHTGTNEVLTKIASGGLLWFLVWLFIGYLIVKSFVSDLKIGKDSLKKVNGWRILIVDVVILTIYLSSFLLSYSVLVIFLLLLFVSLRSVLIYDLKKLTNEKFILKFWALNVSSTPQVGSSLYSFNIFLTVLVSIISLGLFGMWTFKGIGSIQAVRAEAYLARENQKYNVNTELVPTIEEREEAISTLDKLYTSALSFDRNNPLYNRKKALMLLEKIGVVAEQFSSVDEEDTEQVDKLVSAVTALKTEAIEYSRKSTDLAPSVYANWLTRTTIYTGLVGIGFNEYISDAQSSLEKAITLNPLNYQLYYSMAQVYIVKGDLDSALKLLTKVLEINPQHIPSILLIADLNKEKGNMDIYVSYLQAAQQILEKEEATDTEIYDEIIKTLGELDLEELGLDKDPNTNLEDEKEIESKQEKKNLITD